MAAIDKLAALHRSAELRRPAARAPCQAFDRWATFDVR